MHNAPSITAGIGHWIIYYHFGTSISQSITYLHLGNQAYGLLDNRISIGISTSHWIVCFQQGIRMSQCCRQYTYRKFRMNDEYY